MGTNIPDNTPLGNRGMNNGNSASEDSRLVQAALNGDRDASAALVDRYLALLLGFFRYLGVQGDQVEDLAQETFTKALQSLGTFKTGRPFLTWLTTIGRNTFVDDLRRQRKEQQLIRNWETRTPISPADEQLIEYESVADLIANLSPDARFLLELHVVQELSFPQIAELTGEEEGTLRVRFHRLLKHLRVKSKEKGVS